LVIFQLRQFFFFFSATLIPFTFTFTPSPITDHRSPLRLAALCIVHFFANSLLLNSHTRHLVAPDQRLCRSLGRCEWRTTHTSKPLATQANQLEVSRNAIQLCGQQRNIAGDLEIDEETKEKQNLLC
jgi:hypothetical protein